MTLPTNKCFEIIMSHKTNSTFLLSLGLFWLLAAGGFRLSGYPQVLAQFGVSATSFGLWTEIGLAAGAVAILLGIAPRLPAAGK